MLFDDELSEQDKYNLFMQEVGNRAKWPYMQDFAKSHGISISMVSATYKRTKKVGDIVMKGLGYRKAWVKCENQK